MAQSDISFVLDLRCTGEPTQIARHKTITFGSSSPPCTVGDLTRNIEETLEIPASLAKVELNNVILQSDTKLNDLNVRNGDTFIVHYYSEAECREINKCVEGISKLLRCLQQWRDSKYSVNTGHSKFTTGMLLRNLGFDIFLPWLNPKKYANKLYFISKGGLSLVSDSLDILLSAPSGSFTFEFSEMDQLLLMILWNITEDTPIRQAVVRAGGVQCCMKALLQVPVKPHEQLTCGYNTIETMRKSLGVFANLCELPELRLSIASNHQVIEQMLSITFCPSFQDMVTHSVVMILLVLSYSPETHPHLILHPRFGEFIAKKHSSTSDSSMVQTLIEYHKCVLLSILLLMSPQHFSDEKKLLICECLNTFISSANSRSLSEKEERLTIVWDTVAPHVKALYQADKARLDSQLCTACKETVLISLQTMLHREHHQTILVKERLVDYVVCLPWYVTGSVEKARVLVAIVKEAPDVQYQPPSLLNISKAAVAMYYCGLDDVMRLTVPELARKLWDLYYSS